MIKKLFSSVIIVLLVITMAFSSVDTYAGPSKLKYGKYGNRQFYYCMSPYKNLRVEKSTKTMANQKILTKW